MKVVRRLFVTIYDSDGNPYTDADSKQAILIYLKHRETIKTAGSPIYPYTWWDDDPHGGGSAIDALIGGSVAGASLTHIEDGLWYIELDSDTLKTDNEDREDFYVVKTGASGVTTYTGETDASWTIVQGYGAKKFVTQFITPTKREIVNNSIDSSGNITADELVTTFELAAANMAAIDISNLTDTTSLLITVVQVMAGFNDGSDNSIAVVRTMTSMLSTSQTFASMVAWASRVSSGAGTPTVVGIGAPSQLGLLYVDTSAEKVYGSIDTQDVSDWVLLN